jgi:hypothetical protein
MGGNPPADGPTANHIPRSVSGATIGNCDSCHKAGYSSWNPGKFHANISVTGQCATCHLTGAYGLTSKPATTIHTGVTGACENCHKSASSWQTAIYVHAAANGLGTGTCNTCHGGSGPGLGMGSTHIPSGSITCDSCHNSQTSFIAPYTMNHTSVTGKACDTCHNGGYLGEGTMGALGKTPNHVPYTTLAGVSITNCDSCHKAGYTSWNPGRFHQNISVSNQCATCHLNGTYGLTSKPANTTHAQVTGTCESCHKSTNSWLANYVHAAANAIGTGTCDNCHGAAGPGLPKGATHVPITTGAKCDACHNSQTSFIAPYTMNHTAVAGMGCSTCHGGGYIGEGNTGALGKTSNHIPTTGLAGVTIGNCDSCHKSGYATWSPGLFHQNVSITTQCATCHLSSAYGLTAKPATATHNGVTGNCEGCHKTTASWVANFTHSAANAVGTGTCDTCHTGASGVVGKTAGHIPLTGTTAKCDSCHGSQVSFATNLKMNHTNVTAEKCDICHSGAYVSEGTQYGGALGKTSNHIVYNNLTGVAIASCATCHASGYTSWIPGKFHASVSLTTQCSNCHLTNIYGLTAKPATATHNGITGNCESCHKTTASWAATYAHAPANAVGTGTCDTCHTGVGGVVGKTPGHIPLTGTAAKCDACHRSQASFATALSMSHSSVTGATCKSCHSNGTYLTEGTQFGGAKSKPTNHIPENGLLNGATMDCNFCHTGTTAWTTLVSSTVMHNGTIGGGTGGTFCKTCHLSGTSYLGTMEKKSLTHDSPGKTDCSAAGGCHIPLGNKGKAYTKWN